MNHRDRLIQEEPGRPATSRGSQPPCHPPSWFRAYHAATLAARAGELSLPDGDEASRDGVATTCANDDENGASATRTSIANCERLRLQRAAGQLLKSLNPSTMLTVVT